VPDCLFIPNRITINAYSSLLISHVKKHRGQQDGFSLSLPKAREGDVTEALHITAYRADNLHFIVDSLNRPQLSMLCDAAVARTYDKGSICHAMKSQALQKDGCSGQRCHMKQASVYVHMHTLSPTSGPYTP
jgi:hypothetical protein